MSEAEMLVVPDRDALARAAAGLVAAASRAQGVVSHGSEHAAP